MKVGSAPVFRVNGELSIPRGAEALTGDDTEGALKQLMSTMSRRRIRSRERGRLLLEIPGVARYTDQRFSQRGLI